MSAGTSEPYSVQPPTEELYHPQEMEKGVVALLFLFVIEFIRPVDSSKLSEYTLFSTTVGACLARSYRRCAASEPAALALAFYVEYPMAEAFTIKTRTWSALFFRLAREASICA